MELARDKRPFVGSLGKAKEELLRSLRLRGWVSTFEEVDELVTVRIAQRKRYVITALGRLVLGREEQRDA